MDWTEIMQMIMDWLSVAGIVEVCAAASRERLTGM